MQINIMVEGNDDQELVAALLGRLGKVKHWDKAFQGETAAGNQVAIYAMGGYTTLPTHRLLPRLQQSLEVGVLNLVIYDADTVQHDRGGVTARRATLQKQATDWELSFELFLLPTDAADGNLEDLLHQLVHSDHRAVVACFVRYENCLRDCSSPTGSAYLLPGPKDKFYAYAQAMPLTDEERKAHKVRGATKYFTNEAYWNLDAPAIRPLRAFLDLHIR